MQKFKETILAPIFFVVALVVLWEIICRVFSIAPTILPSPTEIAASFGKYWEVIVDNSWQTLFTTLAGFGLAIVFGLGLGV